MTFLSYKFDEESFDKYLKSDKGTADLIQSLESNALYQRLKNCAGYHEFSKKDFKL